MERAELESIFANIEKLTYVNNGAYNIVKNLSPGFVVKISRNPGTDCPDLTTWDYMQWCNLRLMKFGARSPEMVGFPIVLGVINEVGLRMAVMRKCEAFIPTYDENNNLIDSDSAIDMHSKQALDTLLSVFGVETWELDLHSGNIMWDRVRNTLVLTDPFACDHSSSDKINIQPKLPKVKVPKAPKIKRTALWIRAPLQQIYQYHC